MEPGPHSCPRFFGHKTDSFCFSWWDPSVSRSACCHRFFVPVTVGWRFLDGDIEGEVSKKRKTLNTAAVSWWMLHDGLSGELATLSVGNISPVFRIFASGSDRLDVWRPKSLSTRPTGQPVNRFCWEIPTHKDSRFLSALFDFRWIMNFDGKEKIVGLELGAIPASRKLHLKLFMSEKNSRRRLIDHLRDWMQWLVIFLWLVDAIQVWVESHQRERGRARSRSRDRQASGRRKEAG